MSEKVRGALSIDTMVDDLAALMNALGISGNVALAGIAVGGAKSRCMLRRACPSASQPPWWAALPSASRRNGGRPCWPASTP